MSTKEVPNDDESSYWIKDDLQKLFFGNSQFCTSLKEFLFNQFSIQIEISLDTPPGWYGVSETYKIYIINSSKNAPKNQKKVADTIQNLFLKIQANGKQYTDNKVLKWLNWLICARRDNTFLLKLTFLQNLVNRKLDDIITVFKIYKNTLYMWYTPKRLFNDIDCSKLEYFIKNKVLKETILLSRWCESSSQFCSELNEIESNVTDEDDVLFISDRFLIKTRTQEKVLFGYHRRVNELKEKITNIIEKYTVSIYKFDPSLSNYLSQHHYYNLKEIEEKYADFGVKLQLTVNEFSSPQYLKHEIESSLQQILSQSSTITKTFETIPLYKNIAENAKKYLEFIVGSSCYLRTELEYMYQAYPVPEGVASDSQVPKSILASSEQFWSSPDVFKKVTVGNGSIELRTGDIALQDVYTVILPTTFNGLKEGVIDRAGQFDYEKTYIEPNGIMYTETDGGKLKCKRILFSTWLPKSLIDNDNILRLSIQTFISKSIEYTRNTGSIAFAISDSCKDESILAEEMINEAKRQLEINKLQLRVLFVLLPEQQTLYEQFSKYFETTYFDWPMTITKIILFGTKEKRTGPCLENIKKYFSRCIGSSRIARSSKIFQYWNQHLINSFYKYCKDRCILPKLNDTQDEIEFIGPTTGIEEVKKKYYILSELTKAKVSIIERPSSAMNSSRNSTKLYNIVISYNQKDLRKCQRLINRLTEEGFSVWIKSNMNEKTRDIYTQMDKTDCIIVCISENYYRDLSCIDEVKYAFKTDKKIFIVKIQNHPLLGWNDDYLEKKLFFQSFGSENYFDLEYGRLLIELLRHTKPGFSSLLQRRSSFVQQDNENSGRISKREDSASLNSYRKLPNIITETASSTGKPTTSTRQLSFTEQCWVEKLENNLKSTAFIYLKPQEHYDHPVSIVEIPPDRYKSSDFCIAKFPLRGHRCDCSYRSLMKPSFDKMMIYGDQIYGKPTDKIQRSGNMSVILSLNSSLEDFIPRRNDSKQGAFTWHSYNIYRTEEEMEERRQFENVEQMKHTREELAQYFMVKYKRYTQGEMNIYLKFAERMKKNTIEFEKFCLTNVIKNKI